MLWRIKQWLTVRRKMEPGFSIICVYNDLKKLNHYLVNSLNQQTFPFELLAIDNTGGSIKSAARVLNDTAKKARFEYLMFVHQDVALDSTEWLAAVHKNLGALHRLGAAGVAGKSEDGLAASVTHGNPPFFVGPERLVKPVRVQTLDGCLMIVPRKIFGRISFDVTAIEGWYLYAVDYCLDLTRLGYHIYVLPHQVYHESMGPRDLSLYEKTLKNIIDKHRKHTKMIYATMGDWQTG